MINVSILIGLICFIAFMLLLLSVILNTFTNLKIDKLVSVSVCLVMIIIVLLLGIGAFYIMNVFDTLCGWILNLI